MNVKPSWAGACLPPLLLVAILLMGQAPLSFAEDGDDAGAKEHREIETVQVTATRTEASVQEVAVAVSSANAEQVRAQSPDVLPEMLRGLPGTYFQQTTPGQGIPIIRGLKGSQVLHLVDGMRVNNAFFRDAPNQYLGLVDAYAVERVEVVRGAAGSLYGADAMGGVVNFLTPETDFDGSQWQSDGQLYGSWNSADSGFVLNAQAHAGRDGMGLIAGFSVQDHSDRETGNGETVVPSAYRSKAANLKWSTRLGDASRLVISAQLLEQPSTPRTDELVAGFGQDHPASEQFRFEPNRRSFIHARYEAQSTLDWLDRFQLNLARQVIGDDRLTQDFGVPLVRTEQNESTLDGLTMQFDRASDGGTRLTWGFETYADEVRSTRRESQTENGPGSPVRSRFPDHSSMDSMAVFLSSDWHPDDRWTLGAGLRYSRFEIRLPSTSDSPVVDLEPSDLTGDFRFVYALNDNTNLVANVGRGFRPPNIFDLGTLGNRPGNRFNIANPGLRPESVRSYDLGLKSQTDNWQSEIFLFYLDYRDKISSVATGELTDTGRVLVRSENLSEASLYGLEAGFRWIDASDREYYGTLNYTRGVESASGQRSPADRIPPLNGKVGIVFSFSDRFSIDAYVHFAAAQNRLSPRDVRDPRIDPNGSPGWATLNLSATWQLSNQLELGVRLENLADKAYREHASGIDAAGINLGAWATIGF